MKVNTKYFIFNKKRDYQAGHLEGMELRSEGLVIIPDADSGRFLTPVMDSREKSMEWHRLEFNSGQSRRPSCHVSVYASDSLEFTFQGAIKHVEAVIGDSGLSYEEKTGMLQCFLVKQWEGHRDILLHEVTGRFFWIAFELYRQGNQDTDGIWNIQVYFPRKTWLSYLPEVYQAEDQDGFLERFLSVFQTMYEDMNQKIRQVTYLLDADSAQEEYLKWLADWLDMAGCHMWSASQLKRLLKDGVKLYQRRGTRNGILELIRLYTGGECFLVEPWRLECFMEREELKGDLVRLYGMDPHILTVIVKKEDVPTQKEYKSLLRVIDEMKPAQMGLSLVVLEYFLFLGGHCYLGINSGLGEYRKLALDGLAMLPFSTLEMK